VKRALSISTGVELSVERDPSRRYLIPFFGLETGWLFQDTPGSIARTAEPGTSAFRVPSAGTTWALTTPGGTSPRPDREQPRG